MEEQRLGRVAARDGSETETVSVTETETAPVAEFGDGVGFGDRILDICRSTAAPGVAWHWAVHEGVFASDR